MKVRAITDEGGVHRQHMSETGSKAVGRGGGAGDLGLGFWFAAAGGPGCGGGRNLHRLPTTPAPQSSPLCHRIAASGLCVGCVCVCVCVCVHLCV